MVRVGARVFAVVALAVLVALLALPHHASAEETPAPPTVKRRVSSQPPPAKESPALPAVKRRVSSQPPPAKESPAPPAVPPAAKKRISSQPPPAEVIEQVEPRGHQEPDADDVGGGGEQAAETPDKPEDNRLIRFEYELDLYYLPVDMFISLTNAPIPNVGEKSELEIYRDLLFSSYLPRFMVLEVSVNPMPCLGLYVKKHQKAFYDNSAVMGDLNMVKALTAGFEEPYALSLFMGDVVNFTRPDNVEMTGGNKGFMGWLVSVGDYHIKDNTAIYDQWTEVEWKIKGDRETGTKKLSWSFRVGGKFHNNPEITDTVYFSIRRSRLESRSSRWSFIKNGAIQYTIALSQSGFRPVGQELFVEKKFPVSKKRRLSGNIALGVIFSSERKYSGALHNEGVDSVQMLIRPRIEF